MKPSALPLLPLGLVITAAALPVASAQAACVTLVTDTAPPVDTPVDYGDVGYGEQSATGSLPSIQSGLNRVKALATTGETATDTTAAVGSASNLTDPACLAESFGAPLAAQGLVSARSMLDQTLAQLAQRRAAPHAATGTTLYGFSSDQSRREGGLPDTGNQALRVSRADITLGADYRFNNQWVAGSAIGFGAPRLRWAGNSTRIDGKSVHLTSYGSYSPTPESYVAVALGVESNRYLLLDSSVTGAAASSKGVNWGLSVSAGHDFGFGNWGLSPYVRLDDVHTRVGAFSGAGGINKGHSNAVSAGTQLQTQVPTSWGVFAPHARVELTRVTNWRLSGQSALTYAAGAGVLPINNPAQIDRQFGVVGIGASAVLQRGVTLFTDYDTGFAQKDVSSWRFTLGVRTEL
jgi:outer membrane autotransporter protein